MATINAFPASASGLVTFVAANAGGDSFVFGLNADDRIITIRNAGSSITVTLTGYVTCNQLSTHNVVVTAAVGDTPILVPFNCINQATSTVAVTYSSVTSVTVAGLYT